MNYLADFMKDVEKIDNPDGGSRFNLFNPSVTQRVGNLLESVCRIRKMLPHIEARELRRKWKEVRPELNLNSSDRLELCCAMILLDKGIEPESLFDTMPDDSAKRAGQ